MVSAEAAPKGPLERLILVAVVVDTVEVVQRVVQLPDIQAAQVS